MQGVGLHSFHSHSCGYGSFKERRLSSHFPNLQTMLPSFMPNTTIVCKCFMHDGGANTSHMKNWTSKNSVSHQQWMPVHHQLVIVHSRGWLTMKLCFLKSILLAKDATKTTLYLHLTVLPVRPELLTSVVVCLLWTPMEIGMVLRNPKDLVIGVDDLMKAVLCQRTCIFLSCVFILTTLNWVTLQMTMQALIDFLVFFNLFHVCSGIEMHRPKPLTPGSCLSRRIVNSMWSSVWQDQCIFLIIFFVPSPAFLWHCKTSSSLSAWLAPDHFLLESPMSSSCHHLFLCLSTACTTCHLVPCQTFVSQQTEGKRVNGLPLVIGRDNTVALTNSCHVLFVCLSFPSSVINFVIVCSWCWHPFVVGVLQAVEGVRDAHEVTPLSQCSMP